MNGPAMHLLAKLVFRWKYDDFAKNCEQNDNWKSTPYVGPNGLLYCLSTYENKYRKLPFVSHFLCFCNAMEIMCSPVFNTVVIR